MTISQEAVVYWVEEAWMYFPDSNRDPPLRATPPGTTKPAVCLREAMDVEIYSCMNPYLCKEKAFMSHKQHPLPHFARRHAGVVY